MGLRRRRLRIWRFRGPVGRKARLNGRTVDTVQAEGLLASATATDGTPEQIHRTVLLKQLLEQLSEDERYVCIRRRAGWSSKEIGKALRLSPSHVDTLYHRAVRKLRQKVDGNPDKAL